MSPRRWFHVLLGAAFLPVVSLPLLWGVALRVRRHAAADPEARRWSRRILALAVADTIGAVVAIALVAGDHRAELRTVGGPVEEEPPPAAIARPREDRVVIGVMPDPSFHEKGARVGAVAPGTPAEAAGVRAGDVVVELAGEEIPDFPALRAAIAAREPGVAVPLVVVRGGARTSLTVTPLRASGVPPPPPRPLSAPERLGACAPRLDASSVLPSAALVAALGILGALVRRRTRAAGAARAVWWTAAALVAWAIAGNALGVGACLAQGGARTLAGAVVSLWGSSLALGGTALAGLRLVRGEGAPPERSWRSAVALGAWYLVTGLPRVAVLVGATTALAALGPEGPAERLAGGLAEEGAWVPLLFLGAVVVLLGPAAEEIAFRGLLLPALGRWLGPGPAIAATSVLFAGGHWYYGPRLPVVLLVAGVLGWARVASGGLRAPIALHALANAVSFAAVVLLS